MFNWSSHMTKIVLLFFLLFYFHTSTNIKTVQMYGDSWMNFCQHWKSHRSHRGGPAGSSRRDSAPSLVPEILWTPLDGSSSGSAQCWCCGPLSTFRGSGSQPGQWLRTLQKCFTVEVQYFLLTGCFLPLHKVLQAGSGPQLKPNYPVSLIV